MNPGPMLLHYRIHERIGSGGMGDVYRALDPKLDRSVAIKLLPREVAEDPERRRRFLQEARAASSLDHPNIITIFDIAEADGLHFIVMQYVPGKTLGDLLREGSGRLPLSKALDYGIQIADGLAAAHARGIVHRDLKPDNVIVQENGAVKILDWGLAKLVEPANLADAPTREKERPLTEAGHVVGTPAYMSPEQVQGRNVDARSDVFSFGSILYETVTGRRPFAGDTAPLLMASIVRDEPTPPHEVLPSIPLELEKWIARALRKEPERRWQSMADVRVALAELKQELDTGKAIALAAPSRSARRPWLWPAIAIALLAAGALGWWSLSRPEALPPLRLVPLTALPGLESDPAISPDGTQVAFTWKDENAENFDLYVKLIDGGQQLRLTETPENEWEPAWSPDGTRIAFIRHVKDDEGKLARGIFLVSALGGPARPVAKSLSWSHALSWSPEGKLLATVDRESRDDRNAIYLVSIGSGEKRRLTDPPRDCVFAAEFCGDDSPVFSPDGSTVAFVRQSKERHIFRVPAEGGEPLRLTRTSGMAGVLAWTPDGRSLIFSDSQDLTLQGRLWRIPSSGGEPEALPITEDAFRPSLSREGNRMVFEKDLSDLNLWRVAGPKATQREGPRKLSASTRDEFMTDISPDGKKIAFTSLRTGRSEIWVADSDGRNAFQLTFFGPGESFAEVPQWSPDGRFITFVAQLPPDFNGDIYVVQSEGGAPRRLTLSPSSEFQPSWSRDGKWIFFTRNGETGVSQIWKMPASGGEPIQFTHQGGIMARESPDGRSLFVRSLKPGIFRAPVEGGEEEKLVDTNGPFLLWDVYDEGLCFVETPAGQKPVVMCYELATRKLTRVAVLDKLPRWGLAVSPDGKWIVYDQEDVTGSDLILVENFR